MRFVFLVLGALAFTCSAQTYPTKPIRLVVPFAPGGSSTKAAKSPAVVQRYKADDAEAIGSTPQEYADFVGKEQARWKDVIQRAGIKID